MGGGGGGELSYLTIINLFNYTIKASANEG